MKVKNSLFLLVALLTLLCCSNGNESHQKFRFRVDDTLARYDILIFTRVLPGFRGEKIPLVLTVMSPDKKKYNDTLYFPLYSVYSAGTVQMVESGVWRDISWLYREDVIFQRKGLWVFSVEHLSNKSNLNNIRDFEITLKVKKI